MDSTNWGNSWTHLHLGWCPSSVKTPFLGLEKWGAKIFAFSQSFVYRMLQTALFPHCKALQFSTAGRRFLGWVICGANKPLRIPIRKWCGNIKLSPSSSLLPCSVQFTGGRITWGKLLDPYTLLMILKKSTLFLQPGNPEEQMRNDITLFWRPLGPLLDETRWRWKWSWRDFEPRGELLSKKSR